MIKPFLFSFLGVSLLAAAYCIPFNVFQVQAQGLTGVSVTVASTELSATTSYTVFFVAPRNMGLDSGFGLNVWFNGPQGDNTLVDLTEATLNSLKADGVNVAGSIFRADDMQNSTTNVNLGGLVSSGATVIAVFGGVQNAAAAGQYSANVNANFGPNDYMEGTDSFVLGVGTTYSIGGKITLSTTGAGVTKASINANQRGGQLFFNADADTSGNYTIDLPIGEWEMRVSPQWGNNGQQESVGWAYLGHGKTIMITDSGRTTNFEVVPATARVSGKIVRPDGTPADGGVDIRSKEGVGVGTGSNPENGTFTAQVPAGSYRLEVFSNDSSLAAPAMNPFTVGENQTKDLGIITLVQKTSRIKGKVIDKSTGFGIQNVRVHAWSPSGLGWGEATSGADGTFELLVGVGDWEVMPQVSPGMPYAFEAGPPMRFGIAANETVSGVNFNLVPATATINGTVVDVNGNQLQDFWGFAMAMEGDGDPPKPGPGTNAQGGQFSLRVPAGTWTVNVDTEPGSDFSSAGAKMVTLADGETTTVKITMKENDASIYGVIRDDDGNPLTGVRAEVFAENGRGSFKLTMIDESDGSYELGVVGGDSWFLGVFVEPGSGFMMVPPTDSKTIINSGQNIEKNFTVLRANATIEGRVLDPDGNGLSNVFVFADTHMVEDGLVLGLSTQGAPANSGAPANAGSPMGEKGIQTGDLTMSDGSFSLAVPAGTYGLGSGAPSSMGYINPDAVRVEVAKDKTVSGITLQFKESNAQIKGTVTLDGENSEAFVWAWSEKGAHSETFTRTGSFTLNVTQDDVWHIGADYGNLTTFYQSNEYVFDMTGKAEATQDLVLVESLFSMPPSVSQSIDAATGGTIIMEDGTRLVIPAGAFGSSGSYTVTITPTAQLTKEKNNRPIAFGYDITAIDSNGTNFNSNFNSNVRLIIPYTDEMLAALGISENQIDAKYFDSTSGAWQGVASFTVNKDDNTIVASIQHFTSFAATTGSADATPPSNPTDVSVTAGILEAILSWTNPSDSDFDHVNIYRSSAEGEVGGYVGGTSGSAVSTYTDTGLVNGTTYYYSLRAVDAVGNVSSGTTQVSLTATSILPVTGSSLLTAVSFYGLRILLILGVGLVLVKGGRYLRKYS